MKRKKYIFTNKKHSNKAIASVILGIISNISLGIVIYLTYLKDGEAAGGYGVTGVLATLFSLAGLIVGITTVRDKQNYKVVPWLGTILNLLALGMVAFILYLGSVL